MPALASSALEAPPVERSRAKATDTVGKGVSGAFGAPERGSPEPLGASIDPQTVRHISQPLPTTLFILL